MVGKMHMLVCAKAFSQNTQRCIHTHRRAHTHTHTQAMWCGRGHRAERWSDTPVEVPPLAWSHTQDTLTLAPAPALATDTNLVAYNSLFPEKPELSGYVIAA